MKKWEKYSVEELQSFCNEVRSYASLAEKIGYSKTAGGSIAAVKEMVQLLNLDISHFTGQGWTRNQTKETDDRIASQEKYSLEEIFIENSPVTRKVLRGYVERYNLLEYKCQNCGNDGNWMQGVVKLQLHHKDGNNHNNQLSNLEYLCPNCHALTDTFAGKNKGSYSL